MCVQKGMVSGHTQALDSAPVKANASMESLELKKPAQSTESHFKIVDAENRPEKSINKRASGQFITASEHELTQLKKHQDKLRENPVGASGASHEKAQLFSNKTHYSPHDPDARISVKPGKARKLNYHCSMAVDTAQGVISHIEANFADGRDSQYLPGLVSTVQKRLILNELRMTDLLADAGYSNGYNYQLLERQDVIGWIPVFGMYKPVVEGFAYDHQADQFTCPMGKLLPFKTIDYTADGKPKKAYWASKKDCMNCPSKATCTPKAACKRIYKTAYEPAYQRAYIRQQSRRAKQMKQLRQSTVEPVFGSLVQYYGLNKINVLGKEGAHKVMIMAATCFNLKKYLKTSKRKLVKNKALEAFSDQTSTCAGSYHISGSTFKEIPKPDRSLEFRNYQVRCATATMVCMKATIR
ncbi:hypothetical protein GCM10011325_03410 [Dyadobacter sediminis]|nr:hypothetical protein GCM10011325_03410 [Dyadobacter sediminis]